MLPNIDSNRIFVPVGQREHLEDVQVLAVDRERAHRRVAPRRVAELQRTRIRPRILLK